MDQLGKINRKLSQIHFGSRCFGGKVVWLSQLAFALVLLGSLCLTSSAQEAVKSKPKSKKFSSQLKRFVKLGRFEDRDINESSGVTFVKSGPDGKPADAIWTFNDSGGKPILYRVTLKGETEARLKLQGATNRDWESMCSYTDEESRFLAIGDVGDNGKRRESCKIYVVAEPDFEAVTDKDGKLKTQSLTAQAKQFEFTYEDGPNNCEAMGYNSEDNTYWFVEKVYVDDRRKNPPGIYCLPDPLKTVQDPNAGKAKNVATRVADFPIRNVTGMAFSSDNKKLVIRTYFGCFLFEKAEGKTWLETVKETELASRPLPLQSQGEAVCFFQDSNSLLVTSELTGAFIWQVRLNTASNNVATKKEKNESSK